LLSPRVGLQVLDCLAWAGATRIGNTWGVDRSKDDEFRANDQPSDRRNERPSRSMQAVLARHRLGRLRKIDLAISR
jgi:hypothetical protein